MLPGPWVNKVRNANDHHASVFVVIDGPCGSSRLQDVSPIIGSRLMSLEPNHSI